MTKTASHTHVHFFDHGNRGAERGTRIVLWITLATMVVEIAAGWWFSSMALLADGWHMGSHAVAIGLSTFAYSAARRYAHDPSFAFGTWKIEVLSGFASAIFLLMVAALMVAASLERLVNPEHIRYQEAMVVATLGLIVNVVCAVILARSDDHQHHVTGEGSDHQHQDLNLRAAFVHVLADAATSVLAIAALAGGLWYGWAWLDPLMGVVGAALISVWAIGLIKDSGRVLLDKEMDHPLVGEVRQSLEQAASGYNTRISDFHLWRAGRQSYYCILTVETGDPSITTDSLRQHLNQHDEVVHSTIEVVRLPRSV